PDGDCRHDPAACPPRIDKMNQPVHSSEAKQIGGKMTGWKWAIARLAAAGVWAQGAAAQEIVIPNIIELSGGGATVGAMWKNGSSMAVEEINAAGGILGKKIKLEFIDTA